MKQERLARWAAAYRAVAVFLLNTLLVGLAVGAAWAAVSAWRTRPVENPLIAQHGERLYEVYPGRSRADVQALLDETWSRPFAYEPFTEFRERPYQGRFVRVYRPGFRHTTDQGPWPPDPSRLNVFVFGGSTLFGYGVADDETVVSALQSALRAAHGDGVSAYNFGRGFYYSSQERALFERLLAQGTVPALAVFVDGLNEFEFEKDEPAFTPQLRDLMEESAEQWRGRMRRWVGRVPARPMSLTVPRDSPRTTAGEERLAEQVLDRYLRNKQLIEAAAAAFGVRTAFVWQPAPVYRYEDPEDPFDRSSLRRLARVGYERMAARTAEEPPAGAFFWSADLHERGGAPAYVDRVHYSPSMCRRLGEHIAARILDGGFLGGSRAASRPAGPR